MFFKENRIIYFKQSGNIEQFKNPEFLKNFKAEFAKAYLEKEEKGEIEPQKNALDHAIFLVDQFKLGMFLPGWAKTARWALDGANKIWKMTQESLKNKMMPKITLAWEKAQDALKNFGKKHRGIEHKTMIDIFHVGNKILPKKFQKLLSNFLVNDPDLTDTDKKTLQEVLHSVFRVYDQSENKTDLKNVYHAGISTEFENDSLKDEDAQEIFSFVNKVVKDVQKTGKVNIPEVIEAVANRFFIRGRDSHLMSQLKEKLGVNNLSEVVQKIHSVIENPSTLMAESFPGLDKIQNLFNEKNPNSSNEKTLEKILEVIDIPKLIKLIASAK